MHHFTVTDWILLANIIIVGGILPLSTAYMTYRLKMALIKEARGHMQTVSDIVEKTDTKLNEISIQVDDVQHKANSLTDKLVESTKREALIQGGQDEKARADALRIKELEIEKAKMQALQEAALIQQTIAQSKQP